MIQKDTTMSKIEKIYLALIDELKKASESYYYGEKLLMSDYDYDRKYIKLQEMEEKYPDIVSKDSPTQRPGASIKEQKTFKIAQHTHPMLSLKTETDYTSAGAYDFDERIKDMLNTTEEMEYCVELKFDGLGINLKYENGNLVQALTRGDGEYGEDVTANVKMIRRIPKHIVTDDFTPLNMIVRGEIYMGKEAFFRLNKRQADNDDKLYVNPRNAAAGSLRVLDTNITFSRDLSFYAYTLVQCQEKVFKTHYESLMYLQELGFPICEQTKVVYGQEALSYFHDEVAVLRNSLDVEIDGVVYKVNNLALQEKLGFISREPRWAVAHKYPPQEKQTKILGIDIQVGRTGKLTPVARLEPIFVGGATITNVTLHNEEETNRKDIRVGDTVIVRRAGDVIPEITGSVHTQESLRGPIFKMPSHCPVCNSPVVKEEQQSDHRCTGGNKCFSQLKGLVLHFISRQALDIKGVGESLIDQLLVKGIIRSPIDLYKIIEKKDYTLQILSSIEGMGFKSANNVIQAIEDSKQTTLSKFIYALGIRYAGQGTAKRLVDTFKTLDSIKQANLNEILNIVDIGPTVATSVYEFFHTQSNIDMIDEYLRLGITFKEQKSNSTGPFVNKNFVITGTLFSISRNALRTRLEALGANVSDNVNQRTDYLVAGPKAGSKLAHAEHFKIPILDESTILGMLKKCEKFDTYLTR